MKAIIYTRVSTEEQAERGYSLAAQEAACRERAEALGAAEALVFSDPGFSGASLDRPGLAAAREELRKGGAGLFICLDPDRLARNLAHQLLLTDEIEKAGARLEFVSFEWRSTPEGRLFYSLRGAIAEYEREKIRERTLRGRWTKAQAGRLPGGLLPFGYRWEGGAPAADEEEACWVRRLYAWLLEGVSCSEMARRLNAAGVRPKLGGRQWYASNIANMLRLPAYAGVMHVRKVQRSKERPTRRQRPREEWIAVPVPAIVDAATWSAAQRALAGLSRRRGPRNPSRYPLSGLLRCGECGGAMCGKPLRSVRYYACRRALPPSDREPSCGHTRHWRAERLEEAVWAEVRTWLEAPEILAEAARAALPDGERRLLESELSAVEARLAGLARGRQALLDLVRAGAVAPAESEEELRRTREDMERLQARRREIEEALARHEVSAEETDAIRALRKALGDLGALDAGERAEAMRVAVARAVLFPDGRVMLRARIPAPASGGRGAREVPVAARAEARQGARLGHVK